MITKLINMNCFRMARFVSQPLCSSNTFMISNVRFAAHHPIKFMESQDRWKKIDNVSKRWQLIYKAPMDQWLKYLSVYLTFSTTSIACGGLYYAIFKFSRETMQEPVIMGENIILANSGTECLIYIGAFVAFHLALKIVLSKYALRLYQDGDNYLAIFRGHTLNAIKKHEFHLKDFKKLNSKLALAWPDARYTLGTKHVIILENYFKTPEYYNYLLNKQKKDDPNRDE